VFSCDDLRAALSDYLDQELPSELRLHLERHLAECRTCEVLYDSTRKTLRIVTDSTSFELPEAASEQFVKRTMAKILDG
jgi:predicted anti-sigma-YlaC factor YlaD